MSDTLSWYCIDDIDTLDSPALVVYPQRVRSNIQTAIHMVGDVNRLRPHVKTNKSPDVCKLMMAAGIRKFKCATISEAEMLGSCLAAEVLLAYQPLGPKLKRFAELIKKFPSTKWSFLTDNLEAAREQSDAMYANGLRVQVYIDLNVGMNRTGIAPGQVAASLYQACNDLPGLQPVGLHAYDGHLRDRDLKLRKQACDKAFEGVLNTASLIKKAGFPAPSIVAGGTPTFPIHAKRGDVECSPGTFVYWDKGYSDLCPEQEFKTAALLVTRIVSLPSAGTICTDLGHKSVAAENEIGRRIFFLNAEDIKPVGQSEEHLVLEAPEKHSHKVGDVLYGLPYHICPTVALYERVILIENGKTSGEWRNTARDRRINY